jgi:hypothetical protein
MEPLPSGIARRAGLSSEVAAAKHLKKPPPN